MENLIEELSKYGIVHVCKENKVFVLYMTGEKMDNFQKFNSIQLAISKFTAEKYPLVEVLHNSETHLLIVYKN